MNSIAFSVFVVWCNIYISQPWVLENKEGFLTKNWDVRTVFPALWWHLRRENNKTISEMQHHFFSKQNNSQLFIGSFIHGTILVSGRKFNEEDVTAPRLKNLKWNSRQKAAKALFVAEYESNLRVKA